MGFRAIFRVERADELYSPLLGAGGSGGAAAGAGAADSGAFLAAGGAGGAATGAASPLDSTLGAGAERERLDVVEAD